MKRVLVIGGPGSGKSTLSRRLHAVTGLPLFHLDQLYFRPGWQKTPEAEWESTLRQLAAREEWIMDGCYDSSFHIRMPAPIRSSGSICRAALLFRACSGGSR